MQKQKAVMTNAREMLSCGLVLRSIGYRSVAADVDLPFDTARSVVIQKPGKPLCSYFYFRFKLLLRFSSFGITWCWRFGNFDSATCLFFPNTYFYYLSGDVTISPLDWLHCWLTFLYYDTYTNVWCWRRTVRGWLGRYGAGRSDPVHHVQCLWHSQQSYAGPELGGSERQRG